MIEYLQKPNLIPQLPRPKKKNKKNKSISHYPIVLIIIISFLIGSLSGVAASLITNSLIGKINLAPGEGIPTISQPQSNEKPIEMPKIIEKEKIVSEDNLVPEMVKRVSPAVVSIMATEEIPQYVIEDEPFNPFSPFFEEFPGFEIPRYKELPEKKKQTVGRGTGFFVSSDGMILTNKHVVAEKGVEYSIITNDGKSLSAKVLATDPFNDLAILKVEGEKFPYLALGDSDKIKIGQTAIAIGFALGEFRNTVTKGVISGIGRKITAGGGGRVEQLEDVIQTDAAINPGNSGGPLLNLKGEVIGINTAMSLEGQLIGFAIPINTAKYVIESVKKFGKIIRPFLGVRYIIINEALAKAEKLPVDYGALLVKGETQTEFAVTPGSAADKAGLQENDIILELNGQKITQENNLAKMIQKFKPGDEVTLKVLSKGKEKTVKVVLGEYKE